MNYTVIKHSSRLRTLKKCRKHLPVARAFYISLMFSNVCLVLSQCNALLRLLYLLNVSIRYRHSNSISCPLPSYRITPPYRIHCVTLKAAQPYIFGILWNSFIVLLVRSQLIANPQYKANHNARTPSVSQVVYITSW